MVLLPGHDAPHGDGVIAEFLSVVGGAHRGVAAGVAGFDAFQGSEGLGGGVAAVVECRYVFARYDGAEVEGDD